MSPLCEKSMGIVISWASKPHHSEFLQAALFSPCSILSPKTVFIRVLFVIIFSFSWFSCCYGKISDLKQLAYSSSWPLSMAGWLGGWWWWWWQEHCCFLWVEQGEDDDERWCSAVFFYFLYNSDLSPWDGYHLYSG